MKFIKNNKNQININKTDNANLGIDVVCLSNQPWDFELWTNKKQITSRLRDRDYRVLFVDPPLRISILKKIKDKRISLKNLFSAVVESKKLSVYSPFRLTLNSKVSSFNWLVEFFPMQLQKFVINNFFSKSKGKKILWIYHVAYPGLEYLISKIEYDILIYDLVDEYSEMPQFNLAQDKKWIIDRESWLVNKADIIFTSAPGLFNKLKQIKNNTFYTPNAGSFEIFSKLDELQVPEDLQEIKKSGRKIIGFSGAIDSYKVNVDLICKLANNYPDYEFVLIGPTKYTDSSNEVDKLHDFKNIKILGTKPYETLPSFFKYFDAYIIPYNLNSYTVGCFPTKFHDALASGLPTVVTNLEAFSPFSQVCYIAQSEVEFVSLLKIAINEDNQEKKKQRVRVASCNTWDQKLDKQLKIICNY